GAPTPPRPPARERFVLGAGEWGERRGLLIDGGAALPVRRGGIEVIDDVAAESEGTGVGNLGAGEDLDQRRLAGAVLAEEGVHFACADVERHVAQSVDAGERFADRARFE